MSRAAITWRGVRLGGPIALWGLTAALMVQSHLADPFDPTLEGTRAYGHNPEGALAYFLGVTLVELALTYVALRPWADERSWAGPAVALVFSVPWAGFSMLLMMHAGRIFGLHFLWVGLLTVIFAISTAWRAVSSEVARAAPREDPRT